MTNEHINLKPSLAIRQILDKIPKEAKNKTEWVELLILKGWEVVNFGKEEVLKAESNSSPGMGSKLSLAQHSKLLLLCETKDGAAYLDTDEIG